jgi:hypothetical protein
MADKEEIDLSFVIGHKGEERLPHLIRTLRSLFAQREARCEYIVVEQDVDSRIRCHLPACVRHLYIRPPNLAMPYSRSWSFNVGATAARSRLLVFHDNDICAPQDYARELLRLHGQGHKAMRLQRFMFYLSDEDTADFLANERIDPSFSPTTVTQNEQGGTIALDRESFFKIGGFDETFIGWGGEDNEFFERCQTLHGYPYMYLPFVHLFHPAQQGKGAIHANTAYFESRMRIPVSQRIVELSSRPFGALEGPNCESEKKRSQHGNRESATLASRSI